jgi:hypothetical protein
MKHLLFVISVAALAFSFSGCSSASLTATKTPGVKMADYKTFHVEKIPADNRGVDKIIAARLNAMGFQASSDEPPAAGQFDAIVTYQDKWMWDFGMYMIELNVQLRAPGTRMSIATGRSFRTSLVRKTPEGMVEETLGKIFQQQ